MAEASATASSTQRLSFTLTNSGTYHLDGQVSAFGPSTARVSLLDEDSGLTVFDAWAEQTQYDPSGFSTSQAIYAMGVLPPGKYVLWASTFVDAMVQELTLSAPGGLRTRANAYFGVQLDLTPVPLPAAAWMMLSGLGLLVCFGRASTATFP